VCRLVSKDHKGADGADEEWAQHPIKQAVRTHRAPSFSVNPRNGDAYAAYNKPAAVIDWLQHDEVHFRDPITFAYLTAIIFIRFCCRELNQRAWDMTETFPSVTSVHARTKLLMSHLRQPVNTSEACCGCWLRP
jgi:hypothetical protein